jgi:hypothetical protein
MDMYEKSLKMFLDENKVEKENTLVVLKLPIKLTSDGEIDERDFMDRAEFLFMGQTVMISNFKNIIKWLNILTIPKQEWD